MLCKTAQNLKEGAACFASMVIIMYIIENYKLMAERFEGQYGDVHRFLTTFADSGVNEHFHWGRFDWMMTHPCLDRENISRIAIFRDGNSKIAGLALFDTSYEDRWYLLHADSNQELFSQMVEYIIDVDGNEAIVHANESDKPLCDFLASKGFVGQHSESVLELPLNDKRLNDTLPDGFKMVYEPDEYKWRQVIRRGFGDDGEPEAPDEETAKAQMRLNDDAYIKVFAEKGGIYAAHCGVWYDGGETAYIEPVATVPEHRKKGLGKAVVYGVLNIAAGRGAKRAIVLSEQEFYFRIGMTVSSKVRIWTLA